MKGNSGFEKHCYKFICQTPCLNQNMLGLKEHLQSWTKLLGHFRMYSSKLLKIHTNQELICETLSVW